MHFTTYLLFLLLPVSSLAATNCDSNITITNQADADKYKTCTTVSGDFTISSHSSRDITLNGIQKITGSLTCDGADVSSISAPNLTSIGSTFKIDSTTILYTLSFPLLVSVGSIKFTALPELRTLGFDHGLNEAANIDITNTGLMNLDGIALDSVGRLNLWENSQMDTVDMSRLKNYTSLSLEGNSLKLAAHFPNLQTAGDTTVRNISNLTMPALQTLTGPFALYGNTFHNFTVSNLTEAHNITIIDNPNLDLIFFSKLQTVHGTFDVEGPSVSPFLDALDKVYGSFIIDSSEKYGCDDDSNYAVSGPDYYCVSGGKRSNYTTTPLEDPSPSPSSSTSSSTSITTDDGTAPSSTSMYTPAPVEDTAHGSSGLASGAKVGLGVGLGIGLSFLLGIVLLYYLKRKRSNMALVEVDASERMVYEAPGTRREMTAELPGSNRGDIIAELPGDEAR